jgi:dTDP-4-amino-4,6-dideoxygalactose transaminase
LKPLEDRGVITLPFIPDYAINNAHMFYILCMNKDERSKLIDFLKKNKITAVSHYLSLNKSPFYSGKHSSRELANSDRFTDTLLRLPMFYELEKKQISYIVNKIIEFYNLKFIRS